MKRMLKKMVPHIIPETIMFFTKILPIAMILALFFYFGEAKYQIKSNFFLYLYGVLTFIAGIYLMRIIAYAVKKSILSIRNVIPDVYLDESKNEKA